MRSLKQNTAVHKFEYCGVNKQRRSATYMLLPCALLLITFMVLPFVISIGVSLTNERLLSPNPLEYVGLKNYQRLLAVKVFPVERLTASASKFDWTKPEDYRQLRKYLKSQSEYQGFYPLTQVTLFRQTFLLLASDPLFYKALGNTLYFVSWVVPLQVILGFTLALLVHSSGRAQPYLRFLFFLPVVTSMVVVSVVWMYIYQADFGLLNQVLKALTGGHWQNRDWLNEPTIALNAIILMSAWQGAGVQMIIFLAGLSSIPKVLYEAATLDGVSRWRQLIYITLPSLKNTFTFVLISTTILAFALFVQVDVMTHGGPLDSTTTLLYYAVEKGFREYHIAYGSAIALVYFMLVISISLVLKKVLKRFFES